MEGGAKTDVKGLRFIYLRLTTKVQSPANFICNVMVGSLKVGRCLSKDINQDIKILNLALNNMHLKQIRALILRSQKWGWGRELYGSQL